MRLSLNTIKILAEFNDNQAENMLEKHYKLAPMLSNKFAENTFSLNNGKITSEVKLFPFTKKQIKVKR